MKLDGGPAFPQGVLDAAFGYQQTKAAAICGMSLRDYFAAHAITGYMLAFDYQMLRSMSEQEIEMNFVNAAAVAYKMADSMMTERAK